ncbi:MAG: uracil-xanthine permease family protein [Syntrophorhabdaceae bacterium]|nr:uracil-xanthine permease family protein [Syntrophorhabdaceae bacterium]
MKFWDKNDLKDPKVGTGKTVVLGLQHTFTMFGATILVPIILSEFGMSISVALFMAGVCTLLFHLLTRGGVPIFLGSSFAFIAPIFAAASAYGLESALGGVVVAGLIYILMAILVYFLGAQVIIGLFPPIVTGSVIMVIGLGLAPVAIDMASKGGGEVVTATSWLLALMSFVIVVIVSVFLKGFFKVLPVLIGIVISYLIAVILTVTDLVALIEFEPILEAAWFGFPDFTVAKFELRAILLVAPVAICTMVEHIGDVLAVGAICKRDFVKKPGLHRTLLGDGIATSLSAMFGGPANTTYSENTGVLALTRQFNPNIMRIAAVFAILLGLVPKLGAIISSIPTAIIGGISVVLFGMIASIGARTLVENKVDFQQSRNLIISAVILVLGIGGAIVPFSIGSVSFSIEGMALAAIVGIILNQILPGKQKYKK